MYTIRQKQEITDRLKDESNFSKDLQLFQKEFPRSPMNRELARVNDVNRGALCGRMIYALLDVTTEDEIKRNRNSENQPAEKAENKTVAGSAGAAVTGTGEQLEKQPVAGTGEQPEKQPVAGTGEQLEKQPVAGTGEQPEKQPVAGTGEQLEKQPEKAAAESKKKDGKKRSSRK